MSPVSLVRAVARATGETCREIPAAVSGRPIRLVSTSIPSRTNDRRKLSIGTSSNPVGSPFSVTVTPGR